MTLHDEFEQNVKTLVGILDDGIKTTDKWFEDFKKVNEHNLRFLPKRTTDDVISIVEGFYPFRDLFPEILRFLTHHIPNFKDKVESGYSDIKKKTEEIVGKCSYAPLGPPANPVIPYAEMCGLKSSIEQLASDLRFCAKSAREDHLQNANLASTKPAETKQNTSSWKKFFWTLYEKTLKIVVDAVLEKKWHN
jgi:hypothetical protein